jgi:hypothetical protein
MRASLSSGFGTRKAVKARFWPWLEPFPGKSLETFVLAHFSLLLAHFQRPEEGGEVQGYRGTSLIRNRYPPRTTIAP